MWIIRIFAIVLAATPISADADTLGTAPRFEFRGIKAGDLVDLLGLGFKAKQCEIGQVADELVCTRGDDVIADVSAISTYVVFQGRLESLDFSFPQVHFTRVLDSLVARYGKPCRTDRSEWQNKLGVKFDNVSAIWCFSTGELSLKAMGIERDYSSVEYVDRIISTSAASSRRPKVDF